MATNSKKVAAKGRKAASKDDLSTGSARKGAKPGSAIDDQDPPIIIKPGGSIEVYSRGAPLSGPDSDDPKPLPGHNAKYYRYVFQTTGTIESVKVWYDSGSPTPIEPTTRRIDSIDVSDVRVP